MGPMDQREAQFLAGYYGMKSETRGDAITSAVHAGFSPSAAGRLFEKYADLGFQASLKAVGITKPYLAMRAKQLLDLPAEKYGKEVTAVLRIMLAQLGEATDQAPGAGGNVFNGPTMVIVGASAERMKALREAAPQLSREEKEAAENERVERRLEMLRNGTMPPLKRNADGRASVSQPEVLDMEIQEVKVESDTPQS